MEPRGGCMIGLKDGVIAVGFVERNNQIARVIEGDRERGIGAPEEALDELLGRHLGFVELIGRDREMRLGWALPEMGDEHKGRLDNRRGHLFDPLRFGFRSGCGLALPLHSHVVLSGGLLELHVLLLLRLISLGLGC